MTESKSIRDVVDPALLEAALTPGSTLDDHVALLRPVAYGLTRGPNGQRGTDRDRLLINKLIRSQGGFDHLLVALTYIPGLPIFVGAVLRTANNLGDQSLSSEFVDAARTLRPRWPTSFPREFSWWLGGERLTKGNLRRPAIAISNTLGDGDLVTAHRQALAAVDLLELVLGEIEYPKGPAFDNNKRHARLVAETLEPDVLSFRRTLITDNLEPALAEHARFQAEYG